MPDPQPVLRLALPQNGVPDPAMTVRSDTDIDLETGVAHGETMSIEVVLVAPEPIQSPGPNTILFDQSDVAVEPDKLAIWNLVFDRIAAAQMTLSVPAEAVPLLFSSLDRPGDRVAAFVVTVEHGGTVRLTEAEFKGTTTVRIPIEPLITGAPVPPIRYRTETWWGRAESASARGVRPTATSCSPSEQLRPKSDALVPIGCVTGLPPD
jgi:hypothetical protein